MIVDAPTMPQAGAGVKRPSPPLQRGGRASTYIHDSCACHGNRSHQGYTAACSRLLDLSVHAPRGPRTRRRPACPEMPCISLRDCCSGTYPNANKTFCYGLGKGLVRLGRSACRELSASPAIPFLFRSAFFSPACSSGPGFAPGGRATVTRCPCAPLRSFPGLWRQGISCPRGVRPHRA